jgi:hypothetical protein
MKAKSLWMASVLTLATLGIASAKSYDISLSAPAMAGSTELKPGASRLKVEGSQAVFTDQESLKSFSVPVQIENANRKFNQTEVESTNRNGMDQINAIDLGGSNTRITLGH